MNPKSIRNSIEQCISLNTESPYEGSTFVYESRKRRYSMTFWKYDSDYDFKIRYYRHQILVYYFGFGGNDHYNEDEYIYIQNGGVIGTSDHFSVSKKLPLEYCFERFHNANLAKENDNFTSLASLEDKKTELEMLKAIQLLIQCIFEEKINEIYENGWYKHSFDNYLKMLRSDIQVIYKNTPTFSMIRQYIENTHAQNHSFYRINVNDIYTIERYGEKENYMSNLPTKKLLWHGTKVENVASILSRGLEISPPSSKSTGAHFGQGIYFTNSSSKAASYCGARWKWNQRSTEGILLLCEVALGNMIECYKSEDMYPLPSSFNSVWGKGYFAPDENVKKLLWNEVEVPYGPIIEGCYNCDTDLSHDEFVVYDSRQVRIRYLVHVDFEYQDDDYDEYEDNDYFDGTYEDGEDEYDDDEDNNEEYEDDCEEYEDDDEEYEDDEDSDEEYEDCDDYDEYEDDDDYDEYEDAYYADNYY